MEGVGVKQRFELLLGQVKDNPNQQGSTEILLRGLHEEYGKAIKTGNMTSVLEVNDELNRFYTRFATACMATGEQKEQAHGAQSRT